MNLPRQQASNQAGIATVVMLVLLAVIAALLAASIDTVSHTRRELSAIEEEQLKRLENNATARRPVGR